MWNRAAGDRAVVLVDRSHRGANRGASAREAAQGVERAITRALLASPEWTEQDRALWAPVIVSYLADLKDQPERAARPVADAVVRAFLDQYQPVPDPAPEPRPVVLSAITDQFHRLYYHRAPRTWRNTYYRGHRILKLPLDLWVYAELIHKLRPSLIVETGTRFGGSALWLADQLDLLGNGRVVTIDIEPMEGQPVHDRITYLLGSSTDPEIVEEVRRQLPTDGGAVLVVLDSDHARDHVYAEMRAYAPMVTEDSYLIVEDTNINGHPVLPEFGPGPWEAVEKFLAETDEFEPDRSAEKFYVTMNPGGFLRRTPPAAS
jgi:cephalosporin hydroxylase